MKFAFQIDPLDTFNFSSDTSWQLMIEASKRGEVYFFTPQNLLWRNGELLAYVHHIKIKDDEYHLSEIQKINLTEMDVIFIRQNPPYDMNYLTTTYLLEKISNQVLFINNPRAIRDFPEKISTLDYPDLTPPTLITSNLSEAKDFASNYKQVILKPLYSFAGEDVFCLKANDLNFSSIYNNLIKIHQTPIIVQKFIDKITAGDKRIILVDGEPIGAYNRIPQKGDIRANAACGGEIVPTSLTERDIEICKTIKPSLINNGLFLTGIDVIDGHLTEINITSPTGIVAVQKFYNKNITKEIFDKIELKKIKNIY